MTLPAELRNTIYKDVLLKNKVTLVGSVKSFRKSTTQPFGPILHTTNDSDGPNLVVPWREPALLKASKGIRAEASAIYYRNNDFIVRTRLVDFTRLSAWLEHLTQRCGSKLFRTVNILVMDASWADLHHTRTLARVFHGSQLQVRPGELTRVEEIRGSRARRQHPLARTSHGATGIQWRLVATVNAALSLAQRAAREGWSSGELDKKLKSWLEKSYAPR